MKPGEYHDHALPRPSHERLFGTIYCPRCAFFGLGYRHPEWCEWQRLKEHKRAAAHLDLVELGGRAAAAFQDVASWM